MFGTPSYCASICTVSNYNYTYIHTRAYKYLLRLESHTASSSCTNFTLVPLRTALYEYRANVCYRLGSQAKPGSRATRQSTGQLLILSSQRVCQLHSWSVFYYAAASVPISASSPQNHVDRSEPQLTSSHRTAPHRTSHQPTNLSCTSACPTSSCPQCAYLQAPVCLNLYTSMCPYFMFPGGATLIFIFL